MHSAKIASYRAGVDPTGEVDPADMQAAQHLEYTDDGGRLAEADVIIVAVPTPVDDAHQPGFAPLIGASQTAGRHMKCGTTIVFESTVYPGATEEVCVPVIEKHSGMKWKADFNVGYSPERINPAYFGERDRSFRLNVTDGVGGT